MVCTQGAPRARRSLRAPLPGAAIALILALALGGCGSDPSSDGPPPLEIGPRLALPRGIDPERVIQAVADGDGPSDNEPLVVVQARGRRAVTVTPVELTRRKAIAGRAVTIRRVARASALAEPAVRRGKVRRPVSFDVARWFQGDPEPSLFAMRPTSSGVAITVHVLAGRPRPILTGFAPLPRPSRRTRREVAIATWSGTRPDLFVIDRGPPSERIQVAIFSGESGFREPLFRLKLPYRGLPASSWGVDVGRVTQPQPDIVFTTRDPRRRRAEVHVLLGEANFQRFGYERELDLPPTLSDDYLLAFGLALGSEAIVGVDLRSASRRIELIRLFRRAVTL